MFINQREFNIQMTEIALHQSYFTSFDIKEIVNHLMTLPIASGISSQKKVAATQALNAVRILRDRLGAERQVLEFIYTDETIVPKPVARFMREYLSGGYKQQEAENIFDGLQSDMRQYYFQQKIPFDDVAKLPRTSVFDPTGEFTREIKRTLESAVAEYDPTSDSKAMVQGIYRTAYDNPTGKLDFDTLVSGLAELIARKEYSSFVLQVGARNPTAQEFAGKFLSALPVAYQKLGVATPQQKIDRDAVFEKRMNDNVYQRELEVYKKMVDALLL